MANYNSNLLPEINGEKLDDAKERRQILNYLALLDEKLRYMFQNIEPSENFSTAAFENYIKTDKMITSLQVEDGRISALITDMEGNFSMMVQTVNGIRTTVQNQAGQISQVEQTAARIATRVSNAEGDISAIEQTASSIQTSVRNLQGDISVIEQQADKIDWIVASGTSASRFTLTSRMAELISDEIDIYGVVTFNDLSRSGRTEINGDNITTGEISAEFIHLGGYMDVYRTDVSSIVGGHIGYDTGDDGNANTSGIKMASPSDYNYFIATNSGIRMTYDDEYAVYCTSRGVTLAGDYEFRAATNFYCLRDGAASLGTSSYHWDTVFADTGAINTSDRRKKNSIQYDLTVYEELFYRLKPVRYRMDNGKSGRFHTGFIAQDIEEAMEEIGLDSGEFAGFIKSPVYEREKENGEPDTESAVTDYRYSLRYGEFIALNTYMIQKLMNRVAALERELEELRGKMGY